MPTTTGSSARSTSGGFGSPTRLGVQYTDEEERSLYNKISTLNGYTFEVPPVNRFHSKTAESKFVQLTGSLHPRFEAEKFDSLRERLQVGDKKTKESGMQAIALLYAEFLGINFLKAKNIDYAELERCFYPSHLPSYAAALRTVGLKKPLWWRQGMFASLENISRLPLARCNLQKETAMSFEEWYSLFWNYYTPFNTLAYLLMVTAQSTFFNKELIDSTAEYVAYRHSLIEDPAAKRAPILFLGSRTGKFGGLLNRTGRIPVPVIHTHSKPNTNPYLLVIPSSKEPEFKPHPIIKMKDQDALEKYEPSIVLMSDMIMNSDPTAMIRRIGSVREYIYFGTPDSYIEGNAWETWGCFRYRERDADPVPSYARENWIKLRLPHLSRWMIYKTDSDMQMGNGAVTTWTRRPLQPTFHSKMSWRLARLKPFY
ncbi:hypothetical protein ERJ75_000773100 [Trypanosoma vivax]|uniref:Uncharacterized protein n=1 Tax=Trypanosoma vivax (strain Y486) TaxID=1055687 RepID=G0U3K1_TRYVY|nr:hypothetical protein TRVL_02751 [Trypanosoma vivax]KAH8613781.1 hypothetical protein ERJ75_000773100 [Trypanosoma vivax]CCC50858.1 conserved hypothetical protein [Trypanosoma vivax Y486]